MIKFKKEHQVIADGSFKMIALNNPHIFAYVRENESEKAVVISSFSDKPRKFKYLEHLRDSDIKITNYEKHKKTLQPFEVRVYLINKK